MQQALAEEHAACSKHAKDKHAASLDANPNSNFSACGPAATNFGGYCQMHKYAPQHRFWVTLQPAQTYLP